MSLNDTITLPEVKQHGLTARFYDHKGKDMIEIFYVGSKDSMSFRVTPEHMAAYRNEWNTYCDGREPTQRPGTPLTDLSSISDGRAKEYIHRNVHNLEELAALNDNQCQLLGHGTLTDRKGAIALVVSNQMRVKTRLERELHDKQSTVGAAPPEAGPNPDVEALKSDVAELKNGIGQIMELLQARKGGRPKKEKAAE